MTLCICSTAVSLRLIWCVATNTQIQPINYKLRYFIVTWYIRQHLPVWFLENVWLSWKGKNKWNMKVNMLICFYRGLILTTNKIFKHYLLCKITTLNGRPQFIQIICNHGAAVISSPFWQLSSACKQEFVIHSRESEENQTRMEQWQSDVFDNTG